MHLQTEVRQEYQIITVFLNQQQHHLLLTMSHGFVKRVNTTALYNKRNIFTL